MKRNMTSRSLVGIGAALVLGALVAGTPSNAFAAGLVLDASALPAASRDKLRAEIESGRRDVPELYRQVYAIGARANELDGASRAKGAPFTLHFKALGPRALHPMLEMLAFDAHAPKDLTETAARALRLGLVEAVGIVRDARALPVLSALVGPGERDDAIVRSAAEALGRIGTDEALDVTRASLAKAAPGSSREQALLDGVSAFKRLAAAKLLATRLASKPDEATARVVARSLGGVGNAWAWTALTDRAEEAETRDLAARALVMAVGSYRGETRAAIERAVLVVDAPTTKAHLADARRSANADVLTALDALEKKLAANPTR